MTVGFLCGVPWPWPRDVVDDDWILPVRPCKPSIRLRAAPFLRPSASSSSKGCRPTSTAILGRTGMLGVYQKRQDLFVKGDFNCKQTWSSRGFLVVFWASFGAGDSGPRTPEVGCQPCLSTLRTGSPQAVREGPHVEGKLGFGLAMDKLRSGAVMQDIDSPARSRRLRPVGQISHHEKEISSPDFERKPTRQRALGDRRTTTP